MIEGNFLEEFRIADFQAQVEYLKKVHLEQF